MSSTNLEIVRLAFNSLNEAEKEEFVRSHTGETAIIAAKAPPRIIRRGEVAKRAGVTARAVDKWAEEGLLRKVRLPGRKRSIGFLESDVVTFLEARNE